MTEANYSYSDEDDKGDLFALVDFDGEPRVRDIDLGERLGMAQPRDIRRVIDANRAEIEAFGPLRAARAMVNRPQGGGRAAGEFHLNEGQALCVAALSRAPRAPDVREMLIRTFMAFRRGQIGNPMEVLNDPVAMRGLLLTYTEKVLALQAENKELSEKGHALDRIATAEGSLCITDAAKALQIRPKDLFEYLRSHGWIYRRPGTPHDIGYQSRVTSGDLEHKVTTVLRADGSEKIVEQVRVTPKGLAKLAQLIKPAMSTHNAA